MKYLYRLFGSLVKSVALTGANTTSWGFYYQPDSLKQQKK